MQSLPEPESSCEETCSSIAEIKEPTPATLAEGFQDAQYVENLFLEGRNAMLLLKYAEASHKFGEASEILAKHYGSSSPQCADGLFLYGQALFGSSIQRNNIVKSTIVYKTSPKNFQNLESNMQILDGSELGYESETEAELVSGINEEQSDDFENAWHNLDLAREIYQSIDTVDAKLKLAEVIMVLGDIAMESENYRQALIDYHESLSLKQLFLKPDNRTLAEAYPLHHQKPCYFFEANLIFLNSFALTIKWH
ncbi:hypothetical protein K7432_007838 [Basidiobolus ranarum]|uniref:Tetratricopeptide SHNi-TPR domain-containing protein n=1 Tax=Basidiobolus ranarum TaxID=34480 RepID=A0ABR2WSR1_9FUNG